MPDGVAIGGVDVGGLSSADAQQAVLSTSTSRAASASASVSTLVPPGALGASAKVGAAVQQALRPSPGTALTSTWP